MALIPSLLLKTSLSEQKFYTVIPRYCTITNIQRNLINLHKSGRKKVCNLVLFGMEVSSKITIPVLDISAIYPFSQLFRKPGKKFFLFLAFNCVIASLTMEL